MSLEIMGGDEDFHTRAKKQYEDERAAKERRKEALVDGILKLDGLPETERRRGVKDILSQIMF